MSGDLMASFQRLEFNEVDQAPESPGLYAWYGQVRLGAGTWGMQIDKGIDVGELHSRRALQRHTQLYANAPLRVSVESAFSANWSGMLEDNAYSEMQDIIVGSLGGSTFDDVRLTAPKLQNTITSPGLRELLFKALEFSSPVLTSPLYIGVSDNLRKRLNTHVHNLQLHRKKSINNPKYYDNFTDQKTISTFAFRAAKQGFSADTLEVWILDLEKIENSFSSAQLREVAEACEWLLNRWHRPPLGRR